MSLDVLTTDDFETLRATNKALVELLLEVMPERSGGDMFDVVQCRWCQIWLEKTGGEKPLHRRHCPAFLYLGQPGVSTAEELKHQAFLRREEKRVERERKKPPPPENCPKCERDEFGVYAPCRRHAGAFKKRGEKVRDED